MTNDDNVMNTRGDERGAGQGQRDNDPELARRQRETGQAPGEGHSAMPDYVSGPGYTGQIPPEGEDVLRGDTDTAERLDQGHQRQGQSQGQGQGQGSQQGNQNS